MARLKPGEGPSPIVDRKDELERLSSKHFEFALPTDRFISRNQEKDKGVDKTIELLIGGKASNIHAQIQLKGTDRDNFNPDGSLSLQIDTKNLTYLLRNGCGLYIIWIACLSELRFSWARDEAQRQSSMNPDWMEQGTVVVRFSTLLNDAAWDEIYGRVLKEGGLAQQVLDLAAAATPVEPVKLAISDQMEVVSADEAYALIKANGINLVSTGHSSFVRERASLLTSTQLLHPSIQLVLGYASFTLGDYFGCKSCFSHISSVRAALSDFEKFMFDYVLNACDFYIGRLPGDLFEQRRLEIESKAPPALAKQFRFDRLRKEQLSDTDPERRARLLEELLAVANDLEAEPSLTPTMRLQVALARHYAKVAQMQSVWLHTVLRPQTRITMGLPGVTGQVEEAIRSANAAMNDLFTDASKLQARAVAIGSPSMIAESILTKLLPVVLRQSTLLVVLDLMGKEPVHVPKELDDGIVAELNAAIDYFTEARSPIGVTRVRLVLSAWYDTTERRQLAVDQAQIALDVAKAMGYSTQAADAADILAGESVHRKLLKEIKKPRDLDEFHRTQSDEQIQRRALAMVQAAGFPEERVPVFERVMRVKRLGASETVSWCKHLHFVEGQLVAQPPEQLYSVDPPWRTFCSLYKYKSGTWQTDPDKALLWFKNVFCSLCSDRCPKHPSNQT